MPKSKTGLMSCRTGTIEPPTLYVVQHREQWPLLEVNVRRYAATRSEVQTQAENGMKIPAIQRVSEVFTR